MQALGNSSWLLQKLLPWGRGPHVCIGHRLYVLGFFVRNFRAPRESNDVICLLSVYCILTCYLIRFPTLILLHRYPHYGVQILHDHLLLICAVLWDYLANRRQCDGVVQIVLLNWPHWLFYCHWWLLLSSERSAPAHCQRRLRADYGFWQLFIFKIRRRCPSFLELS